MVVKSIGPTMIKRQLIKTSIFCIGFPLIVYLSIISLSDGYLKSANVKDGLAAINQIKKNCSWKQDLIKKQMKIYCSKIKIPHEKIEEMVITTEMSRQLAYCHVPKVASSLWMLAFADMNYMDKNLTRNLLKRNALHGVIMTNFSFPLKNNKKEIEDLNNSSLYKFLFIRHPFERLVSAFHDKFEVKKQGDIMVPFLKHEIIKNMFNHLKKPKSQKLSSLFNLTFENFINFVLEEAAYDVISEPSKHWWPYSDLCKLCKVKYDFIGSLESLNEDTSCMLSNFKEYKLLQKMKDRLKMKINAEGRHTKEMTMEYFANLSKETIGKLYELYKVDFILGNYGFPQAYINIGTS